MNTNTGHVHKVQSSTPAPEAVPISRCKSSEDDDKVPEELSPLLKPGSIRKSGTKVGDMFLGKNQCHCGKFFETLEDVEEHKKNDYPTKKSCFCSLCPVGKAKGLVSRICWRHVRTVHEKRCLHMCVKDGCPYDSEDEIQVLVHMDDKHKEEFPILDLLRCHLCDKFFSQKKSLKKHKENEVCVPKNMAERKKFVCDPMKANGKACIMCYVSEKALNQHKAKKHSPDAEEGDDSDQSGDEGEVEGPTGENVVVEQSAAKKCKKDDY